MKKENITCILVGFRIYCVYLWVNVDQSGAPGDRRSAIKQLVEHMFLGQYQHSIDEKGRLTVPVRYREKLAAEGAYVTMGFDHNLMLLTVPAFNKLSVKVNRMSLTNPRARDLRRWLFSRAELVLVDRAGRILIPQFLREAVNLDGEAIFVGAGEYVEIWAPPFWSGQNVQMLATETDDLLFMDLDLSPGD